MFKEKRFIWQDAPSEGSSQYDYDSVGPVLDPEDDLDAPSESPEDVRLDAAEEAEELRDDIEGDDPEHTEPPRELNPIQQAAEYRRREREAEADTGESEVVSGEAVDTDGNPPEAPEQQSGEEAPSPLVDEQEEPVYDDVDGFGGGDVDDILLGQPLRHTDSAEPEAVEQGEPEIIEAQTESESHDSGVYESDDTVSQPVSTQNPSSSIEEAVTLTAEQIRDNYINRRPHEAEYVIDSARDIAVNEAVSQESYNLADLEAELQETEMERRALDEGWLEGDDNADWTLRVQIIRSRLNRLDRQNPDFYNSDRFRIIERERNLEYTFENGSFYRQMRRMLRDNFGTDSAEQLASRMTLDLYSMPEFTDNMLRHPRDYFDRLTLNEGVLTLYKIDGGQFQLFIGSYSN